MFDDQNQAGSPPPNLPMEPADMFADTDVMPLGGEPEKPNAIEAGVLKKADSSKPLTPPQPSVPFKPREPFQPPTDPAPIAYDTREPFLGKIILLIVLIVVLAGLGYGAWWFYNNIYKGGALNSVRSNNVEQNQADSVVTTTDQISPVGDDISTSTADTNTENVTSEMNNDAILFGEPIDSDKDGLDDIREEELGTDPRKPDSDDDGLKDGDEVIIWRTNPSNEDTDGDTFVDGKEIANGYNPLGPGKLQILPQTESASSTTTATGTVTSTDASF